MSVVTPDLWELALHRQQIDPNELVAALETQAAQTQWDYRTRLLIRDSLEALSHAWGRDRVRDWIARSAALAPLKVVWDSDLGPPGFDSLRERVMETTKPETILQFFRELGQRVRRPTRIDVGGSASLILAGLLSWRTEDVVVVHEVPLEIRSQHDLIDSLASRYHIRITHFQSHYLPAGWEQRVHSLGVFYQLSVFLVDPYDVFVGSSSARGRRIWTICASSPDIWTDRGLKTRIRESAAPLRSEKKWAEAGARNWYIVFGATLPS